MTFRAALRRTHWLSAVLSVPAFFAVAATFGFAGDDGYSGLASLWSSTWRFFVVCALVGVAWCVCALPVWGVGRLFSRGTTASAQGR